MGYNCKVKKDLNSVEYYSIWCKVRKLKPHKIQSLRLYRVSNLKRPFYNLNFYGK